MHRRDLEPGGAMPRDLRVQRLGRPVGEHAGPALPQRVEPHALRVVELDVRGPQHALAGEVEVRAGLEREVALRVRDDLGLARGAGAGEVDRGRLRIDRGRRIGARGRSRRREDLAQVEPVEARDRVLRPIGEHGRRADALGEASAHRRRVARSERDLRRAQGEERERGDQVVDLGARGERHDRSAPHAPRVQRRRERVHFARERAVRDASVLRDERGNLRHRDRMGEQALRECGQRGGHSPPPRRE